MAERSWLYVPGHRPDRFHKAVDSGADAVIFDLEDAVPMGEKADALRHVVEFLGGYVGPAAAWVRVNAGTTQGHEVDAAAALDSVQGVVVPKATPEVLMTLADRHPDLIMMPLVESAIAVQRCADLAGCRGVRTLAMGEVDLAADLGLGPDAPEAVWWAVRTSVVVGLATAGRPGPVGPVSVDFRDLDAFAQHTRQLRSAGFSGRQAIHPAQVAVINEVFIPTHDELDRARRLLQLADAAQGGVCVDDDGRMIDEAVLRSARRLLEQA